MKTIKHENKNSLKHKNKKRNCFNVFKFFCFHDQRGATALVTIVIIAAAALIMALNASLLGIGDLEIGYTSQKGGEALSLADGCAEETLRRIKIDNTYGASEGEQSLSIGDNSCIITVEQNGNNRIIYATSTVDNFYKVVRVNLTLSGDNTDIITINSWQEQ